jgi:hypothetical protein
MSLAGALLDVGLTLELGAALLDWWKLGGLLAMVFVLAMSRPAPCEQLIATTATATPTTAAKPVAASLGLRERTQAR